jgi:cell division protein FtsW (lipid II flippase)
MKRIVILVVAIGLMMVPSAALAQSSTCQAYNPQTCESSSESSSAATTTTATTESGTLPFTGLDVALLAAGGGTLLAAGFVVRRLSRRTE